MSDPVASNDHSRHRLIYTSASEIPRNEIVFKIEIGNIMDACMRNNPRNHVTGVLVFDRGLFVQLLEGPRDGVERTLAAIAADPRHGEVAVRLREPAPERLFADWSMAFVNTDLSGGFANNIDWISAGPGALRAAMAEARQHCSVLGVPVPDGPEPAPAI